jgi:uncharacterized OsmC-like protein
LLTSENKALSTMPNTTRLRPCGCHRSNRLLHTTELVWDAETTGTGTADDGRVLRVGPHGEWSPEELLSLAAEASLMAAVLSAAERTNLEILGYVSSAGLMAASDGAEPSELVVTPCIVVGSQSDAQVARRLAIVAARRCSIRRILGSRLRIEPRVVVIAEKPEFPTVCN